MKGSKITALVLAAALCAMPLTACAKEKKPVSSGINVISTQSQAGVNGEVQYTIDPNAESNNFCFKLNGVTVAINAPLSSIESKLDTLGKYTYTEQASCAGQGMDKIYTFNGGSFTIYATPVGKDYTISMIAFGDDSVSTAEGVCIGNTVDQLKKPYGEPKENDDTTIIYEKGTSTLVFVLEDGKILNIVYNAKV